jgi:predicted enzyme related to lactoylglutathione lyase
MQILGIYAALIVSDIARAERFYTMLFERGPDDRPMAGFIQWRNVAGANIQLFEDAAQAGHGRCTIVVPDMAEAKQALGEAGYRVGGEQAGDFGRIAQLRDPDGNLITLAEPPR